MQTSGHKEWRGHPYALTQGADVGNWNPSSHYKNAPRHLGRAHS
jgi:hypothetical protein